MNQAELTKDLIFDYYLISSARELEVFSPEPAYLNPDVYHQMIASARTLYGLVSRLVVDYLQAPNGHPSWLVPGFPHRRRVLEMPLGLPPFFWVRYDAFERADGGIFFSEFNYDKPCAQREILVSAAMKPAGNPNEGFAEAFRTGIYQIWQERGRGTASPTVGVLVDPNHYEETHLAYLYADLLQPLGWSTRVAGAQNIRVKNNRVLAYGQPLDIILRQFPTEYSHEIPDYAKLVQLYANREVLILNDPRTIVPQAKSLFAYLWRLVETRPDCLSAEEKRVITATLPYTRLFTPADRAELLANRDKWVVKAVYGRYSEEVYIGAMMAQEEWQAALETVANSEAAYIIQEFVPIKKQVVNRFAGGEYEDTLAHGNYGVYFTNGEYTGLCVRWSTDYLTADDTVWFSPVGVREQVKPYCLRNHGWSEEKRRQIWREVANTAVFTDGYSTSYTGEYESFSLESLSLSRAAYNELVEATEGLTRVFQRAVELVQANLALFGPLLGIPESLWPLVEADRTPWLTWLGRLDWAFDKAGRLRLLELNTDTPAGLESIGLNSLVGRAVGGGENPNRHLDSLLAEKFAEMLDPLGRRAVIGLVTTVAAEEDGFNTRRVAAALEHLPYELVLGDITGLVNRQGRLQLYGRPLDALYRFYPLDWLGEDETLLPVMKHIPMINPPRAIISQSKAFLALVRQLQAKGFYSATEEKLLASYLTTTCLEWSGRPSVIKPYFGREGQGILFSRRLSPGEIKILAASPVVYQDEVAIQPLAFTLRGVGRNWPQVVYPVVGAYIIGNRFGGLYTRLGGRVTDRYAVVCPTFVEE